MAKHKDESDEPEVAAAEAPEMELSPIQQTVAQENNHKANVVNATGTQQSTIAAATTTRKGGGSQATYIAAVKSADIAYYQAFIASAQAQNQPVGGAIDALKTLGAW